MSRNRRYPPEVRERAVALVHEHQSEHRSQWAAMQSIASKFGMAAETLRNWVRQAERDRGLKPGPTSEELVGIEELVGRIDAELEASEDTHSADAIVRDFQQFLRQQGEGSAFTEPFSRALSAGSL